MQQIPQFRLARSWKENLLDISVTPESVAPAPCAIPHWLLWVQICTCMSWESRSDSMEEAGDFRALAGRSVGGATSTGAVNSGRPHRPGDSLTRHFADSDELPLRAGRGTQGGTGVPRIPDDPTTAPWGASVREAALDSLSTPFLFFSYGTPAALLRASGACTARLRVEVENAQRATAPSSAGPLGPPHQTRLSSDEEAGALRRSCRELFCSPGSQELQRAGAAAEGEPRRRSLESGDAESAASLADRLRDSCWDEAACDAPPADAQLPLPAENAQRGAEDPAEACREEAPPERACKKGQEEQARADGLAATAEDAEAEGVVGAKLALYFVDRIVGVRRCVDGSLRFKVRWSGYSPADDTWEPLQHLAGHEALLEEAARSLGVDAFTPWGPIPRGAGPEAVAGAKQTPHLALPDAQDSAPPPRVVQRVYRYRSRVGRGEFRLSWRGSAAGAQEWVPEAEFAQLPPQSVSSAVLLQAVTAKNQWKARKSLHSWLKSSWWGAV